MGRRGPAPTPTKAKLADGETRPSRINRLEPTPRRAGPVMPRDMDKAARAVWRHVMREMATTEVITAADAQVLRIYCEAVARYLEAQRMYEQSAPLIKSRGVLVKNPLHQVVRDNADQVRQLARELRPAARVAVRGSRGPTPDMRQGPPLTGRTSQAAEAARWG